MQSRDIKKHKNDVFRLVAVIDPEPDQKVPERIKTDMRQFLAGMQAEEIDCMALGLGKRTKAEVFAMLHKKFGL